jgi:hypothetical protein
MLLQPLAKTRPELRVKLQQNYFKFSYSIFNSILSLHNKFELLFMLRRCVKVLQVSGFWKL